MRSSPAAGVPPADEIPTVALAAGPGTPERIRCIASDKRSSLFASCACRDADLASAASARLADAASASLAAARSFSVEASLADASAAAPARAAEASRSRARSAMSSRCADVHSDCRRWTSAASLSRSLDASSIRLSLSFCCASSCACRRWRSDESTSSSAAARSLALETSTFSASSSAQRCSARRDRSMAADTSSAELRRDCWNSVRERANSAFRIRNFSSSSLWDAELSTRRWYRSRSNSAE
mmetsp:Transcript_16152/g.50786  ORF Transcript_16152/g.50786 Transcript_16152/m.50786 type:complete len:243 (-) Transcript_16152:2270-2998(-)